MPLNYPELVVPAAIGLFCVLYVLPWHIRVRNLATLSMSFWMVCLSLIHIINPLIWNDGVENKAPVWCDISSALTVGYNYGLPLSHLLLARQLEGLTTLRKRSVLFDERLKRTSIRAIFNLLSYANGPSPLSKNTPPKPVDLKTIGYIPKDEITDSQCNVLLLQWYTVTVCSIIFFFCFATGSETVKFYHRVLRVIFPFIPDRTDHFKSLQTPSSSGFSSKPSQSTFSSTYKQAKSEGGDVMPLNYLPSPTRENEAGGTYAESEPATPHSPSRVPVNYTQHYGNFALAVSPPAAAQITTTVRGADSEVDVESGRTRTVRLDSVGIDEDGELRERMVRHSQMPSKLSVQTIY
ncbi:hypothetical protein QFC21_005242 [Naganishia friedmannii]|uniref:Uncharacterized protein n=1 Tax=Naganishia friedmannii TaxID=89922 RepID=A0ACC2VBX1_9TREE|nr:hypothetical protein QFC21_005242 [Naganishia friedmannii]